jgi:hypothetical protein
MGRGGDQSHVSTALARCKSNEFYISAKNRVARPREFYKNNYGKVLKRFGV